MITIEQTIASCYDCTGSAYNGCEDMPSVNKNLRHRLNPNDGQIPVWCPRRKRF